MSTIAVRNNAVRKNRPFKNLGRAIRRYYRENGEFFTMAWAGLNPNANALDYIPKR